MATRWHPRPTIQLRTAAWLSTRQERLTTSESCLRPTQRDSCIAVYMPVQPGSALSPASRPTRLPHWLMARSTDVKHAPKRTLPASRTPRNITNPRTLDA
eukprot:2460251-Pleurochrysis_carterae.AAC.1